MPFNSVEFAVFLVAALLLHHVVLQPTSWTVRKWALAATSYLFYASWSPPFALLLGLSTVVDWLVARRLERARTPVGRRVLLLVSLGLNLGVLCVFKYGGFVAANLYGMLGWSDPPLRDVVLPIGISFYTFEALSYTIDVYRGAPACRRFGDFALFLSFFPHLVAGPIVRPGDFLPQLHRPPRIDGRSIELALVRIAQGVAKKVVLADTLGVYVDRVWELPAVYGRWNVLVAIYAYAFQIYFDFSGYTDIALGVAQLFGLKLSENFDRPYLARTVREFWQRWHVSLSSWLRDYLYIALGGNRAGRSRTLVNLLCTMVLGGLWHGAAWTFVAWGTFHGLLLVAHHLRGTRPAADGWRAWRQRCVVFHVVCIGWVVFRAPSLGDAAVFLRGLGRSAWEPSRMCGGAAVLVGCALLFHVLPSAERVRHGFVRLPPWAQGAFYATGTVLGYLLSPTSERFIYFQF